MITDQELAEIEARVAVSAHSDDFGHDCQALLEFESHEYTYLAEQAVPRLIAELRAARKALIADENGNEYECVRAAKEENERLREALKKVVVGFESRGNVPWEVVDEARAALGEGRK